MNIKSLKLFKDIQLISTKYSHIKLKNDEKEIEDNRKLSNALKVQQGRFSEIVNKCNFVAYQTKEEFKNLTKEDVENTISALNSLSFHKYSTLSDINLESTTSKVVLFATLDELNLINKSITNKEYLTYTDAYTSIYKDIIVNSFITFLALKDMNLDENMMNNLSQGIFNQIRVISLLSL
ncbi:MAG: hypothetical protein RRZ84_00800 [Romboutsia sp.]